MLCKSCRYYATKVQHKPCRYYSTKVQHKSCRYYATKVQHKSCRYYATKVQHKSCRYYSTKVQHNTLPTFTELLSRQPLFCLLALHVQCTTAKLVRLPVQVLVYVVECYKTITWHRHCCWKFFFLMVSNADYYDKRFWLSVTAEIPVDKTKELDRCTCAHTCVCNVE